jgi:hypothetical protein
MSFNDSMGGFTAFVYPSIVKCGCTSSTLYFFLFRFSGFSHTSALFYSHSLKKDSLEFLLLVRLLKRLTS